jgi:hypothetical protein
MKKCENSWENCQLFKENYELSGLVEPVLYAECCGWVELALNESDKQGKCIFQGKFQEANGVNKNKRMYPFDVLSSNVVRLEECMGGRSLYGELDHPSDSIIHLKEASHLVTKLWWEGNTLMGQGEVLPTPAGMILKKIMDSGCRVGISSRGVGNGAVNNEGVLVIGESYKLITFDAVADPSTFSAFQKRVAGKNESVSVPSIQNNYTQSVKNESKSVHNVNEKTLIPFIGSLMQKYTNELKTKIVK